MKEVYPAQKLRCSHPRCKKSRKTIEHREHSYLGFTKSGELIPHTAIHKECYNLYGGRDVKKRYKEMGGRHKKREVRYEISPDHLNYNMEKEMVKFLQNNVSELVNIVNQEKNVVKYDEQIINLTEQFTEKFGVEIDPQIINNQVVNRLSGNLERGFMVGKVEKGASNNEFIFKSDFNIKQFDFVCVVPKDQEAELLLCQVMEVQKVGQEKVKAQCKVVGYRDNKNLLKKTRSALSPGAHIYVATQKQLEDILGLSKSGMEIGVLENESDLKVRIDPNDFLQHVAVLAKTGYGKSYLTGVFVEELVDMNIPVVVIDPHGEYGEMKNPNELANDEKEKYSVIEQGFNVKEFGAMEGFEGKNWSFDTSRLSFGKFLNLCPNRLTDAQKREVKNLFRAHPINSLRELRDAVTEAEMNSDTRNILFDHVTKMLESSLYSDTNGKNVPELLEKGVVTVLNLKGVNDFTKRHIMANITKELFRRRKNGQLEPFIMVVEESQKFCPSRKKCSSERAMTQVASEGRKFGMGLVLVSQRPSYVSKDVLSQCKRQFILRLTNSEDLKTIRRSFEDVDSSVESVIKDLPQGVNVALGEEYPLLCDVRVRRSKHGGVGSYFDV